MEAITFKDVSFAYAGSDRETLKKINLTIAPSEFTVLCGKSGCGKSTLLRQLKKNLIPYGEKEGKVLFYGQDIETLEDRESVRKIGFVQQNPDNQIVTDKVWHELAFGLESLGYDNASMKRRVAEMASFFGIQTWFRKNVSELSGGQKQLINLASVMVMQPELLILDEPTSQLDPIAASEFMQTLYKINRELGTAVLISEHRLEELFPMADRVIVMEEGKILIHDIPKNTALFLAKEQNAMFYGLPSAAKIFSMTGSSGACPLSVREGRLWMEEHLDLKKLDENPTEKVLPVSRTEKEDAILLKDVWFRYHRNDRDILKGVDLQIKKGEWVCILGGNGVGKSTTLKSLTGIVKPQRGKIQISERMSMLPQNPQAVFTEISVEEDLLEALYGQKLSEKEQFQRVEEMLDKMELRDLRKSHPYDLSGGEQQRLALGKILLQDPKILVLDEPTKGLDPFFKRKLGGILEGLHKEGMTIFMVSHDIEFCAEYADYCAMFFDGEVVAFDDPVRFFSGNRFYTTIANRIAGKWFPQSITCEEVAKKCRETFA